VPELLREELAKELDLITIQPNIGPRVASSGLPEIRRFHLSRIHYHLYYRVREDVVEILAFWHTSRGTLPDLKDER
jgi:plasmid stabilization system protein ParE